MSFFLTSLKQISLFRYSESSWNEWMLCFACEKWNYVTDSLLLQLYLHLYCKGLFVCRTALRLHLNGEQLATQLLMTSAWNEAAVQVIQREWNEQVNCVLTCWCCVCNGCNICYLACPSQGPVILVMCRLLTFVGHIWHVYYCFRFSFQCGIGKSVDVYKISICCQAAFFCQNYKIFLLQSNCFMLSWDSQMVFAFSSLSSAQCAR